MIPTCLRGWNLEKAQTHFRKLIIMCALAMCWLCQNVYRYSDNESKISCASPCAVHCVANIMGQKQNYSFSDKNCLRSNIFFGHHFSAMVRFVQFLKSRHILTVCHVCQNRFDSIEIIVFGISLVHYSERRSHRRILEKKCLQKLHFEKLPIIMSCNCSSVLWASVETGLSAIKWLDRQVLAHRI